MSYDELQYDMKYTILGIGVHYTNSLVFFLFKVISETQITVYEGLGPLYINVISTVPPHLYCHGGQKGDNCGASVSVELIKG